MIALLIDSSHDSVNTKDLVKQAWTSDDSTTFESEAECAEYESECRKRENHQREHLERIISYVLSEAEYHNGCSEECIDFFKSIDSAKMASYILQIENFVALVADVKKKSENAFYLWKNNKEYSGFKDFLPEERWMRGKMFAVHPFTEELEATGVGLTGAFEEYPIDLFSFVN